MYKKIIIGVVFIIMIGSIFFLNPKDINKTYDGYMYSNDTDFGKQVEIVLEGRLYRKFLGNHRFLGKVKSLGVTRNVDMTIGKGNGLLFYRDKKYKDLMATVTKDGKYTVTDGIVMVSKNFDMIWLEFDELDKKYGDEFVIYGPANNKSEAHKVNLKFGGL